MQNYREAGQTALDILEDVKAKLGLRSGLELICAVRGADSDSERIAACALDKFLNVLGTGVGRILGGDIYLVLNAGECAKLCLDDNSVIVSVLNDLTGERNVILKGLGGCVDHDGGEAAVYAGFAKLIAVTVVKMECYGKSSLLDRSLNKLHQIGVVCVRARALGHLEDDRSFVLCGGLCDAPARSPCY